MSVFSRSENWICKTVFEGEEAVLVPLIASEADLSAVLVLNDTANFIWQQLDEPRTKSDLAQRLCDGFDFDSPEDAVAVGADVEHCLRELVRAGALREC